MQHLGDITKLSGYDLPPVDVITGGSPCFPAGTLVLTDEGYVEIENVKVGMKVLTHKGRWRSVTSVGSTNGETVVLKGNHYGVECTLNHPIYSTNTHRYYPRLENGKRGERVLLNNEREWIPASEMQGRLWAVPRAIEALPIDLSPYHTEDKHCNPLPEFNEDFFYFVGRWLGDGWVRANQRTGRPEGQCWGQIVICDGLDKEDELRETVKRIADAYNIEHCKTAVKIKFVSKILCKWLTDNFGQYSYGKQLPSWIYGMNVKWRAALLKGLMDSDGHYIKDAKSKTGRITTTSKRLAEGLRLLLEIQGFSTTIFREIPSKTKNIEGRTVNQRTYYIVQFCDRNGCARVHFEDEQHSWYRVRSVTKTNETKTVYNLAVDEDNSYVADGIVVHNCQDLSTAGKRKGLAGERSGLFMEQIRLIKEMRDATNGKQPRYMVWENVCFDGNTLVTTKNGLIPIKNVKAGMFVRTVDGSYQKVLKNIATPDKPVIKIAFQGGEIICTPNHPFLTRDMTYKPIGEFSLREQIGFKVDIPGEKSIGMAKAYAFGRWLADGSCAFRPDRKTKHRIFISTGYKKYEALKNKLNDLPYPIHEHKMDWAVNFTFTSDDFGELTDSVGYGARNKQVPEWVFELIEEEQKAVLQGYLDGDGHCRDRGHGTEWSYSTSSERLAYGIARLVRAVHHVGVSISYNKGYGKTNICGRIVNANDYWGCFFTINRKGRKSWNSSVYESGYIWVPIKSIKECKNRDVYNLSVEGNHTYEAYGVCVHNCGTFSSNKGEDFRCVLEETAKIADKDAVIPGPPKGKWAPAGLIVGDGWSIAWRVHDAQFWGVPQRRKRICLLADFSGDTAGKILFELRREALGGKIKQVVGDIGGESRSEIRPVSEGVSRDTQEGRKEGQGVAADVGTGIEETGRVASTITATYGTKWNGNAGAYNGGNFVIQERRT